MRGILVRPLSEGGSKSGEHELRERTRLLQRGYVVRPHEDGRRLQLPLQTFLGNERPWEMRR
jgi:hypothetical protein